MSKHSDAYTADEIARLGDDIYLKQIRSQVEPGQLGKVVAIDVATGAFAIGENARFASQELRVSKPEAIVWLVRIGQRAYHRMG